MNSTWKFSFQQIHKFFLYFELQCQPRHWETIPSVFYLTIQTRGYRKTNRWIDSQLVFLFYLRKSLETAYNLGENYCGDEILINFRDKCSIKVKCLLISERSVEHTHLMSKNLGCWEQLKLSWNFKNLTEMLRKQLLLLNIYSNNWVILVSHRKKKKVMIPNFQFNKKKETKSYFTI